MAIRIATPGDSKRRQAGWSLAALLAITFGLAVAVGVLTEVNSLSELLFGMILIGPGLTYVVLGLRVLQRVTGQNPGAPVSGIAVLAFGLTSALGALGMFLSFVFWGISRSSYVHEGGDPASAPDTGLYLIAICGAVAIVAGLLISISSKIEDPPAV